MNACMDLVKAWKHRKPTAERVAENRDPLAAAELRQVELLREHGVIADDAQLERSETQVLDDATRDDTGYFERRSRDRRLRRRR